MTINVGLGSGGKAQQFAQTIAIANVRKEIAAGKVCQDSSQRYRGVRSMLKEPDVVRLKRTMPEIPVPPGSLGTIVYVHHADPPGYLVEFPDALGANGLDANGQDTAGVYPVDPADLELVWREGHWYVSDLERPGNI